MNLVKINGKLIVTACILLTSLVYLFAAKDLVLGTMKRPGVGFLPVLAGALLACFSLIELIKSSLNQKDLPKISVNWIKITAFFFGATLYTAVLNFIGYELATFGLLIFLTKLYGAKSWVKPIVFAALLSWGSYYVFAELLLVPLP